jgi:hypothetical protein
MQTIANFIADHGIRMTVKPRNSNPNMPDDGWAYTASHWTCTLHFGRQRMAVAFSQGSAHFDPPKLADVLDCLASDASGLENARDFADWCAEYGYDTDSRKAERTYKAIKRQASRLKAVLGTDYETLLFDTERQ